MPGRSGDLAAEGLGRTRIADGSGGEVVSPRERSMANDGPRAPWRPRVIVIVALTLVAGVLGGFAYVLASSQARSRHEAQQGFLAQATTAAALTKAILSAIG